MTSNIYNDQETETRYSPIIRPASFNSEGGRLTSPTSTKYSFKTDKPTFKYPDEPFYQNNEGSGGGHQEYNIGTITGEETRTLKIQKDGNEPEICQEASAVGIPHWNSYPDSPCPATCSTCAADAWRDISHLDPMYYYPRQQIKERRTKKLIRKIKEKINRIQLYGDLS